MDQEQTPKWKYTVKKEKKVDLPQNKLNKATYYNHLILTQPTTLVHLMNKSQSTEC